MTISFEPAPTPPSQEDLPVTSPSQEDLPVTSPRRRVRSCTGLPQPIFNPPGGSSASHAAPASCIQQERVKHYPLVTDEEAAKKFNHTVISKLADAILHCETAPPLPEEIGKFINVAGQTEVNRVFKPGHSLRANHYSNTPRAKFVWESLLRNPDILGNGYKRLRFLQVKLIKELDERKKRTVWASTILSQLNKILGDPAFNLKEALHVIDHEIHDAKALDLILKAFGRKRPTSENVLGNLRKFSADQSIDLIKKKVTERSKRQDEIAASLHSKRFWHQSEAVAEKDKLEHITVNEIVRCLIPGTKPLYHAIRINGKELDIPKLPQGEKEAQILFLKTLLEAVYQAGFAPAYHQGAVVEQAHTLTALSRVDWKKLAAQLTQDPPNWGEIKNMLDLPVLTREKIQNLLAFRTVPASEIDHWLPDQLIPCMPILRLCSNSCWGHADGFIREKTYPGLFTLPYWSKLKQDMELEIDVESRGRYNVKQKKTYGTYPRLSPSEQNSFVVDEKRLLALTTFCWNISPCTDGERSTWKGVLEIADQKMTEGIDDADEDKIYDALIGKKG